MKKISTVILMLVMCGPVRAGPFIELGLGLHGIRQSQDEWEGKHNLGGSVEIGVAGHLGSGHSVSFSWQRINHPWPNSLGPTPELDSILVKWRYEYE